MGNHTGQVELTIMSHLYCEPIAETELKRKLNIANWAEIMATLADLIRKALVMDIHKDSNGPVYTLTRKGKVLLEKRVANTICS
jgi:predicted transcriptional regulator